MSDHFDYRDGTLFCEQVPLEQCAAEYGTPLYVYSRAGITQAFRHYQQALASRDHLICYAVKANSNIAVIELLASLGSGFDIVSGGELARVLAAGGDPGKIIFSGVGKRAEEMRDALQAGIRCFNVESAPEMRRLGEVALEAGQVAPISIRVNPDVDAQTHPYISTGLRDNKFGVDSAAALELYRQAADHPALQPVGIDCHIGSQITEIGPFVEALERMLELVDTLAEQGITLDHIDVGGGLGVPYQGESLPPVASYVDALTERLGGRTMELILEPGRSIVANAGVLLTRIEYLKPTAAHNFAIVDAAMNDLLRPSLYSAWQDVMPVTHGDAPGQTWDIVGPVCETGDFLAKERVLSLADNDLLAVAGAGAYGFTMSSNYNSRPRPAEIMVDGSTVHLVRARETVASLWAGEYGLGVKTS